MCGILFTDDPSVSRDLFEESLSLMNHRGPDCQKAWNDEGVYLGHARLSIQDLSSQADQPYSIDDRYLIIFNGEIYNFKEISSQYSMDLKTFSDTEVLLRLYLIKGEKVVDELNGMFTFLVYDKFKKEYFVARDRLGIKPLYISHLNGFVYISSEVRPILNIIGNQPIDDLALRQYRKMRAFFCQRTLYSTIKSFPPATYSANGIMKKYWELSFDEQEAPSYEELDYLIRSSVEYRKISDAKVGCFLSGGLDSSIIASLSDVEESWSVGFSSCNEFEWSRLVAQNLNQKHNEITITKNEFLEIAKEMILSRRMPLSVPNEVLINKLCQNAQSKVKVLLSGEGADELFFGYDRIFRWAHENQWSLKDFIAHYSYSNHQDDEVVEEIIDNYVVPNNPLKTISSFFQIEHLQVLLGRLDGATMQNSIEARVPFVDHRLIERMAGVNYDFRIKDGVVKHPLKKVFSKIIPKGIIERQKIGFPVPLSDIFGEQASYESWLSFNLEILGIQ